MSLHLDRLRLNSLAENAGLIVSGVATVEPFADAESYILEHIESGHLSGFDWYTAVRARQSADPRTLQPNVRSIVSVAVPFWTGTAAPPDGELRGRIARYAWGRDYHKTLKVRMKVLVAAIDNDVDRPSESRQLVDTARAYDRAIAARAGVGWYGKNSMIIVPGHGSWVMLGELYLDLNIEPDQPLIQNCGRCTFCIGRCPTGAIVEPYRVDSPRCISYLTIEERGPLPRELRPLMGKWVFGCDVCQDVCPYTGAAREMDDPDFHPKTVDNAFPSLDTLARMSEEEFRALYSGTAVTRAKRAGMARNAAVALGNSQDERAEPILTWMLTNHDQPLARGHAAWALRHLADHDAKPILEEARRSERDRYVLDEITWALENTSKSDQRGSNGVHSLELRI
jgi:epoxyqueuosine reductase